MIYVSPVRLKPHGKPNWLKAEWGIQDKPVAPTLAEFAENTFIPFVETKKKDKPRTVAFYKTRVSRLKTFPSLWNAYSSPPYSAYSSPDYRPAALTLAEVRESLMLKVTE